jgi:hypothetical protein
MKIFKTNSIWHLALATVLVFGVSCERSVDGLDTPGNSTNPDVFIDGFSGGLNYAAFGGSVPTAFQVDNETTYGGSNASMRFEVPDFSDPRGAYAGGAFFTGAPRDLSGYDALTFWARATESVSIDIIGFGNDLGESPYQASISGLLLNSNWKKFIIPLPDASKLTDERGMFFYSEGPEEGTGFTFWIDHVKFEKLGTVAHQKVGIFNGENRSVETEPGETVRLDGMYSSHNLPTGVDQQVTVTPRYLNFETSNPAVATVDANGVVSVVGIGTAQITASLPGAESAGSLTVNSIEIPRPSTAPPAPTQSPQNVIGMYTNAYTDVPIDTWNTRWEFSTTDESYLNIAGQDVIRYSNLNFVGIEFTSQKINASQMTFFRLDIWTPENTNPPNEFKVLLVDFGADGNFGGGDDSSHELTFRSPLLRSGQWVTLNIPMAAFTGLRNRSNLAQLVLSGTIPTVYVTNVYFYR